MSNLIEESGLPTGHSPQDVMAHFVAITHKPRTFAKRHAALWEAADLLHEVCGLELETALAIAENHLRRANWTFET